MISRSSSRPRTVDARRRLKALRDADRQFPGSRGRHQPWFVAYIVAITLLVVVAPVMAWAVNLLSAPGVAEFVEGPDSLGLYGVFCLGLTLGLLGLARIRPALTVRPFWVMLLASTETAHKLSLRRTFWTSAAWVTAIVVGLFCVLAMSLTIHGDVPPRDAFMVIVHGLCVGIVSAVAWLAGQVRRAGWLFGVIFTTVAVGFWGLVTSGMFGISGALVGLGQLSPAVLIFSYFLVPAALLVTLFVPRLLGSVPPSTLMRDAYRWEYVGVSVVAGDLALAATTLRAQPSTVRRLSAVARHGVFLRYVRMDLVAAIRTPLRATIGALSLCAGWFVLCLSTTPETSAPSVIAACGALLIFMGLSPYSDGLRFAAQLSTTPAITGLSLTRMLWRHSFAPATILTLCAGVVAVIFAYSSGTGGSLMTILLLLPVVMSARVYSAVKSAPPVSLLVPTPTPVGDLSAISLLMWHVDAFLYTGIAAAGFTHFWTGGEIVQSLGVLVGFVLLFGWLARGVGRRQ